MNRASAESLAEICARHSCVQSAVHADFPRDLAPYDTIAIRSGGDVPVGAHLIASMPTIRSHYEVVEIYVRRDDEPFEPLTENHFAWQGSWVVVAKRRHPNNEPRIVGIMLAKDEADAIPDVIESLSKTLDVLYYLAGDSATADAIVASARNPAWARAIKNPGLPHSDGLRQFLLEEARIDAITDGDPRPVWVMNAQGDEIYHDDLRHHILLAQAETATVLNAQVATFLFHESQKEGWDWSQPLATRFTHYIWDFAEHGGFLDFPWIHYIPGEHMRAHPHGLFPGKWAEAWPVRKHYPFRSPEQARARIIDRLKGTAENPHGSQPHYQNYKDLFMGDTAAGRPMQKFFGWFPEAKRAPGVW